MELTISQRLTELIQYLGESQVSFSKKIGVPQSSIATIIGRGTGINSPIIEKIHIAFPIISIDWLLLGKGSMLKSEQIPSIKERLNHFIKESNIDPRDFCESIGMSFPYFSEMKGSLPERYLNSIKEKYPQLSAAWLMSGEGSMLKSTTGSEDTEEQIAFVPTQSNTVNYKLVPLLNLDAVGGMHSPNIEAVDSEFINRLIPFTDAQDGDVALMVSGESMSPTCPSGSKVLIREVPKWNEYFGYGNLFVLLLTDGRRILKEVQKWQEDPKNFVLCRSHNDKYPEEELPKSMIAGVWKVIKILNERGW